jgi:hypothetical protein
VARKASSVWGNSRGGGGVRADCSHRSKCLKILRMTAVCSMNPTCTRPKPASNQGSSRAGCEGASRKKSPRKIRVSRSRFGAKRIIRLTTPPSELKPPPVTNGAVPFGSPTPLSRSSSTHRIPASRAAMGRPGHRHAGVRPYTSPTPLNSSLRMPCFRSNLRIWRDPTPAALALSLIRPRCLLNRALRYPASTTRTASSRT